MEILPTTLAFWSHWREEHRNWSILEADEIAVATDEKRDHGIDPLAFTAHREACSSKTDAHTYIALRCAQYALEKLGVL